MILGNAQLLTEDEIFSSFYRWNYIHDEMFEDMLGNEGRVDIPIPCDYKKKDFHGIDIENLIKEKLNLEVKKMTKKELFELEQKTTRLIGLMQEYDSRHDIMSSIEYDYNTVENWHDSLLKEDMTTEEKQCFNNIKDNMTYLRNNI